MSVLALLLGLSCASCNRAHVRAPDVFIVVQVATGEGRNTSTITNAPATETDAAAKGEAVVDLAPFNVPEAP